MCMQGSILKPLFSPLKHMYLFKFDPNMHYSVCALIGVTSLYVYMHHSLVHSVSPLLLLQTYAALINTR